MGDAARATDIIARMFNWLFGRQVPASPALVAGGGQVLPIGSTAMTGWTVGGTGGPVGLQNGPVDGVGPVDGRRIDGALEHPYYAYALVLERERGASSPGRP